jgi:hypothetical protein
VTVAWLVPLLVGIAGGLASGLLGVGGGILFVPLLARFRHLDQKRAQGTSLAILVFTALAGAATYRAHGPVNLALAGWIALGAMIAARLGARATVRWSSAGLRRAFGLLAIVVAGRMFVPNIPEGSWLAAPGVAGIALDVLVGFGVGYLAGLLGVGGGLILVPILTLLFGIPQHEAQGVSLFMIVPTAIVGSLTHLRLGNVETRLVLPVAAGSIVAAVASATIAHHLPAQTLRMCFAVLLVWMGARMVLRPVPR